MPVKSEAHMQFMQMMAHNPKKKKKKGAGPSPEVAREFIEGNSKEKKKNIFNKRKD